MNEQVSVEANSLQNKKNRLKIIGLFSLVFGAGCVTFEAVAAMVLRPEQAVLIIPWLIALTTMVTAPVLFAAYGIRRLNKISEKVNTTEA